MDYKLTRRDALVAGAGVLGGAMLESQLKPISRLIDGIDSFLTGFFNRAATVETSPAYVGESILEQAIVMEKEYIHIHDGDTLTYKGKKIRFAGIDTAEKTNDRWPDQHGVGEFAEHNCAEYGRLYVQDKVDGAQQVAYIPCGVGGKGRQLGYIVIDRELLQYHQIMDGVAYETVSHFGNNGFPKLAAMVLDAAKTTTKKPHFEKPHLWKKQF